LLAALRHRYFGAQQPDSDLQSLADLCGASEPALMPRGVGARPNLSSLASIPPRSITNLSTSLASTEVCLVRLLAGGALEALRGWKRLGDFGRLPGPNRGDSLLGGGLAPAEEEMALAQPSGRWEPGLSLAIRGHGPSGGWPATSAPGVIAL